MSYLPRYFLIIPHFGTESDISGDIKSQLVKQVLGLFGRLG